MQILNFSSKQGKKWFDNHSSFSPSKPLYGDLQGMKTEERLFCVKRFLFMCCTVYRKAVIFLDFSQDSWVDMDLNLNLPNLVRGEYKWVRNPKCSKNWWEWSSIIHYLVSKINKNLNKKKLLYVRKTMIKFYT